MSTATSTVEGSSLRLAVSDSLVLTKRSLLRYVRIPSLVVFSTVQPVMFVLLFRYVFGGAINITGGSYVNFLMPGVFVQSAAFGSIGTRSVSPRTCRGAWSSVSSRFRLHARPFSSVALHRTPSATSSSSR